MAESGLSLTYDDLAGDAGYFLGYGRDDDSWTADQEDHIDRIVQSGLRKFYSPNLISGQQRPHQWTFLRPVASFYIWNELEGTVNGIPVHAAGVSTITLSEGVVYPNVAGKLFKFMDSENEYTIIAGDGSSLTVSGNASAETTNDEFYISSGSDFRLPDDFGGLIGPFTYPVNETYSPIDSVPESVIRVRRQNSSHSGHPSLVALRPLRLTPTMGQRFEVIFWPDVDAVHELKFKYQVLADRLSSGQYPYGGMMHAETIREAVLSVAEQDGDDMTGIHTLRFYERLTASIALDSTLMQPEYFGFNGDNSDNGGGEAMGGYFYRTKQATYNGVLPS